MLHDCLARMLGIDKVELNHQLTSVADTEAESVVALVEVVKRCFCLFIPEESSSPSLG